MNAKQKQERGFTLVELAITLVISGFLLSSALFSFQMYTNAKPREDTIEAIENSQTAAYISQVTYGAYPCPADPTLPSTDPNYGRPDCAAAVRLVGRDADNADGDNNPLTGGDIALMGAVPFNFFLDPDGDGDTSDEVLQGDYKNSLYSAKDGFDRWGNKLTYVVTESLTQAATYDATKGVIDIVDETLVLDPNPLVKRQKATLLDNWGTAHFVILSHGPNGVGAYTIENGNLVQNCNLGLTAPEQAQKAAQFPVAFPPDETENCENTNGDDATFLSGLPSANRSTYNDDIVKFMVNKETTLWENTGAILNTSTNPPTFITQIQNTNSGNVGFGMKDPTQRADIDGDLQAYEVHADDLCDPGGADCMDPNAIGGNLPNMQCPPGQVVRKISNNAVQCTNIFSNASFGACPAGQVMTGLSSQTGPICIPRP